jgi:1-aminocyclopropane-1-carboxylate deaminase
VSVQKQQRSLRRPSPTSDLDRLAAAPRVPLGSWPTPIDEYTDPVVGKVYVKRDDLSGWGRGGAKARKVEHLVGHLVEHDRNELITVAGNVTNLAFDLLPALDRHGIRATLFIQDEPYVAPPARARIFSGVLEEVTFAGESKFATLTRALGAYLSALARGGRPFLLLPGASHPAAVVGNACGFIEMVEQYERERRHLPAVVYVTAATGTTLAGFLLAETALRRSGRDPIRVVGVQVYPGRMTRWALGLVRWTEWMLGLSRMPAERIEILDSTLHGGFADFPPSIVDLCERIEGQGGPRLDPVFGGKTWSAMRADLTRRPATDRPPLYWHCGYTPEWRTLGNTVRQGRGAA